jgi:hypothetical protein
MLVLASLRVSARRACSEHPARSSDAESRNATCAPTRSLRRRPVMRTTVSTTACRNLRNLSAALMTGDRRLRSPTRRRRMSASSDGRCSSVQPWNDQTPRLHLHSGGCAPDRGWGRRDDPAHQRQCPAAAVEGRSRRSANHFVVAHSGCPRPNGTESQANVPASEEAETVAGSAGSGARP